MTVIVKVLLSVAIMRVGKDTENILQEHPICANCRNAPASVVDHIKPHKGDYDLFWDEANHQALCKRCHDIKTATEDGGFGNDI